MAAGYYRLDIRGSHFSQEVQNTFYYTSSSSGAPVTVFDAPLALDVAQAWLDDLETAWLLNMPTEYNLDVVNVTFVDSRGVTDPLSYAQELPSGAAGQNASDTAGSADCAIIAFPTAVATGAGLPMKRSYIAYGPVPSGFFLETGALSGAAVTLFNTLATALKTPIEGADGIYYPVRVGRTVSPDPIRVGVVINAFVRANKRVRRSRLL